jgi:DNA-binding transcriptional MocR family regulator
MSTPKRATVYFEPELYRALRARAVAADCSMSELINAAVRDALAQGGAEISALDRHAKGGRASYERLQRALTRRRLVRRSKPTRA